MSTPRKELKQMLNRARANAEYAFVRATKSVLADIREYASAKGLEIPEYTLKRIEKTAFRKAAENTERDLRLAMKHARGRYVYGVKWALNGAWSWASEIGLDIEERVREIEAQLKEYAHTEI